MATDFTKAPLEILVDLIDLTNGCLLTTSDINFGPVSSIVGASRNSAVTVYARLGSSYEGMRALTYNRVNFSDIPQGRSKLFVDETAETVSDLIPAINSAYLLNIQPEDYYNDDLPTSEQIADGVDAIFLLRARPESYIFRGEVELLSRDTRQLLSDIFHVSLLNGFVANASLDSQVDQTKLNGFVYIPSP